MSKTETENKSQMVVCDYFQLSRSEGKFQKDHKKLIRKNVKISRQYMDQMNLVSETSGKLYVENVKETDSLLKSMNKAAENPDADASNDGDKGKSK